MSTQTEGAAQSAPSKRYEVSSGGGYICTAVDGNGHTTITLLHGVTPEMAAKLGIYAESRLPK